MFSAAYLCLCLYCMLQLGFSHRPGKDRPHVQNANEHYFADAGHRLVFFCRGYNEQLQYWTGLKFFPFAVAGNYLEIVLNTALIPIF